MLLCYWVRKGSKMSMREVNDVPIKTKLWDIFCFLCGSYLINMIWLSCPAGAAC